MSNTLDKKESLLLNTQDILHRIQDAHSDANVRRGNSKIHRLPFNTILNRARQDALLSKLFYCIDLLS